MALSFLTVVVPPCIFPALFSPSFPTITKALPVPVVEPHRTVQSREMRPKQEARRKKNSILLIGRVRNESNRFQSRQGSRNLGGGRHRSIHSVSQLPTPRRNWLDDGGWVWVGNASRGCHKANRFMMLVAGLLFPL